MCPWTGHPAQGLSVLTREGKAVAAEMETESTSSAHAAPSTEQPQAQDQPLLPSGFITCCRGRERAGRGNAVTP